MVWDFISRFWHSFNWLFLLVVKYILLMLHWRLLDYLQVLVKISIKVLVLVLVYKPCASHILCIVLLLLLLNHELLLSIEHVLLNVNFLLLFFEHYIIDWRIDSFFVSIELWCRLRLVAIVVELLLLLVLLDSCIISCNYIFIRWVHFWLLWLPCHVLVMLNLTTYSRNALLLKITFNKVMFIWVTIYGCTLFCILYIVLVMSLIWFALRGFFLITWLGKDSLFWDADKDFTIFFWTDLTLQREPVCNTACLSMWSIEF